MVRISLLVCSGFLLCAAVYGQSNDSPFKVTQLTDKIYQLSTDEGSYTTNLLLSVGDDGILMVDANETKYAKDLKKIVVGFGKGLPKYIINTHRHVEHVGGNAIFGPDPVVVAHYLVPEKLRHKGYLFEEFPPATFPDILVYDSLSIVFNGEKIRVIAVPGSHDDNEVLVHFTDSKIVHMSSLVNGLNFPSVDTDGDALKFADVITRAMGLIPHDVTIVSGHNGNCRWDDLPGYLDMIKQSTEIVRRGLADGKDLETLQQEKVLAQFEKYDHSYVSQDGWISYLVNAMTGDKSKPEKPDVYEPLFYAMKEGGGEAAAEKFRELKRDHPDEYQFREVPLIAIGERLIGRDKADVAVPILLLCAEEFPDEKYEYYTHYLLAEAYRDLGDRDKAIQQCQESLKLKEDGSAAKKLLDELRKQ